MQKHDEEKQDKKVLYYRFYHQSRSIEPREFNCAILTDQNIPLLWYYICEALEEKYLKTKYGRHGKENRSDGGGFIGLIDPIDSQSHRLDPHIGNGQHMIEPSALVAFGTVIVLKRVLRNARTFWYETLYGNDWLLRFLAQHHKERGFVQKQQDIEEDNDETTLRKFIEQQTVDLMPKSMMQIHELAVKSYMNQYAHGHKPFDYFLYTGSRPKNSVHRTEALVGSSETQQQKILDKESDEVKRRTTSDGRICRRIYPRLPHRCLRSDLRILKSVSSLISDSQMEQLYVYTDAKKIEHHPELLIASSNNNTRQHQNSNREMGFQMVIIQDLHSLGIKNIK